LYTAAALTLSRPIKGKTMATTHSSSKRTARKPAKGRAKSKQPVVTVAPENEPEGGLAYTPPVTAITIWIVVSLQHGDMKFYLSEDEASIFAKLWRKRWPEDTVRVVECGCTVHRFCLPDRAPQISLYSVYAGSQSLEMDVTGPQALAMAKTWNKMQRESPRLKRAEIVERRFMEISDPDNPRDVLVAELAAELEGGAE